MEVTEGAVAVSEEVDDPYAEFLIVDRNYDSKGTGKNAKGKNHLTLMDSAAFSSYEMQFYLNKTQIMYEHEYSVLISGITENFPPACGHDVASAHDAAAAKALEILARRCYTVKFKSHPDPITKEDLLRKASENVVTDAEDSVEVIADEDSVEASAPENSVEVTATEDSVEVITVEDSGEATAVEDPVKAISPQDSIKVAFAQDPVKTATAQDLKPPNSFAQNVVSENGSEHGEPPSTWSPKHPVPEKLFSEITLDEKHANSSISNVALSPTELDSNIANSDQADNCCPLGKQEDSEEMQADMSLPQSRLMGFTDLDGNTSSIVQANSSWLPDKQEEILNMKTDLSTKTNCSWPTKKQEEEVDAKADVSIKTDTEWSIDKQEDIVDTKADVPLQEDRGWPPGKWEESMEVEDDVSLPQRNLMGFSNNHPNQYQMLPPCMSQRNTHLDHPNHFQMIPPFMSQRNPHLGAYNPMPSARALPDSCGSRMMKKMGWSGGGLGKDGKGISKPIETLSVKGRFGVGHQRRNGLEMNGGKSRSLHTNYRNSQLKYDNASSARHKGTLNSFVTSIIQSSKRLDGNVDNNDQGINYRGSDEGINSRGSYWRHDFSSSKNTDSVRNKGTLSAFVTSVIRSSRGLDDNVPSNDQEDDCEYLGSMNMEADVSLPQRRYMGFSNGPLEDLQMPLPCMSQGIASLSARDPMPPSHSLPEMKQTDSFASRMMQKMGWSGGGLGKDGKGITEPIETSLVKGRFGFGHKKRNKAKESGDKTASATMPDSLHNILKGSQKNLKKKKNKVTDNNATKPDSLHDILKGSQKNFKKKNKKNKVTVSNADNPPKPGGTTKKKKAKGNKDSTKLDPSANRAQPTNPFSINIQAGAHCILKDFCDNSKERELIFSRKLSSLHRKLIHDIAPDYGLSSISFGFGAFRHLVLFRDHTVDDYLENLQKLAQENKLVNFEIIPPSGA